MIKTAHNLKNFTIKSLIYSKIKAIRHLVKRDEPESTKVKT